MKPGLSAPKFRGNLTQDGAESGVHVFLSFFHEAPLELGSHAVSTRVSVNRAIY